VLERLCDAFAARFGRPPERAARAPGRVNLIGEHTDYNEGLVLPFAIDRAVFVALARRRGSAVRALACDLDDLAGFDLDAPRRVGGWIDYVQGVVRALRERGAALGGFDLAVASDLPRESGLSSSAALGVAVATALDAAFGLGLSPRARAEVARRAESAFVGVPCGIMDPFASALGRRDRALYLDCRSLDFTPVPLPRERVRVLVADSGVRRALAAGGYGDRQRECREALHAAQEAGLARDARALRDLGPADLPALARVLPPPLLRRTRHVVTENERVSQVRRALEAGRLEAAGECLREGMRSLRDDFEVSIRELDELCALADGHPAVLGSRLTGAGFGGCTLHLVRPEGAADAARWIAAGFAARYGRRPPLLEVAAEDGAAELPLGAGRGA
jgi:galactokinase